MPAEGRPWPSDDNGEDKDNDDLKVVCILFHPNKQTLQHSHHCLGTESKSHDEYNDGDYDYYDDFVKHDNDDFLLSQLFDRLSQCKEVGTIEGAAWTTPSNTSLVGRSGDDSEDGDDFNDGDGGDDGELLEQHLGIALKKSQHILYKLGKRCWWCFKMKIGLTFKMWLA